MRRLGIIGLLFAFCGSAQAVDTALYHRTYVHAPVNTAVKRANTFQGDFFRYSFASGSNVLPFSMVGKMSVGGYISSDVTADVESRLKGNNRAGIHQQFSLVVYPLRSRVDGWGAKMESGKGQKDKVVLQTISVRTVQTAGAKFSDDAYRLAFRGNGYYRGHTLAVGENHFQLLGYNAVDFQFRTDLSQHGSFDVSVLQATSFSRLQTANMSLFTSASGDSLAFNGRYFNQGTGSQGWGQRGMGLSVGFTRLLTFRGLGGEKRRENTHYLRVGVRDLGFLYMPRVSVQSRGYVWDASMRGLSVAGESPIKTVSLKQAVVNAKELQLSNWFGNQRDSATSRLQLQDQTRSGTVLVPFTLFAELPNLNIKGQKFGLNATYLHVRGYRISNRLWWNKLLLPKGEQKWTSLNLQPYLATGGFDTYDLGMAVDFETPIKRLGTTYFRLDVRGLEAWVMPNKQHGAGLSAAMVFKL
jgi:hypothetical protein